MYFVVLSLIALLLFPRSDGLNDIIAKLNEISSDYASATGVWVVDYFLCSYSGCKCISTSHLPSFYFKTSYWFFSF